MDMLTVHRRHNPALCKSTDRYYKRCTCPTWVEGTVGGKDVRLSLKTHSWERAVAKVRKMDATEDPTPAPTKKDEPFTIEKAVNEYLSDAKARELGEATLYKLNIIFRKQLLAWSKPKATSSFVLAHRRLRDLVHLYVNVFLVSNSQCLALIY